MSASPFMVVRPLADRSASNCFSRNFFSPSIQRSWNIWYSAIMSSRLELTLSYGWSLTSSSLTEKAPLGANCIRWFPVRRKWRKRSLSPHGRESGFRNPRNFCLRNLEFASFFLWNPESWALESGIQLKECGILLTIGIQDTSSTDKESEIQNLESRIQDCLGFSLTWGKV